MLDFFFSLSFTWSPFTLFVVTQAHSLPSPCLLVRSGHWPPQRGIVQHNFLAASKISLQLWTALCLLADRPALPLFEMSDDFYCLCVLHAVCLLLVSSVCGRLLHRAGWEWELLCLLGRLQACNHFSKCEGLEIWWESAFTQPKWSGPTFYTQVDYSHVLFNKHFLEKWN